MKGTQTMKGRPMRNLKLEHHCKGHGKPSTFEAEFALKAVWWAPDLEGVTIRVIVDTKGNVKTKVNKNKEVEQ